MIENLLWCAAWAAYWDAVDDKMNGVLGAQFDLDVSLEALEWLERRFLLTSRP